jgi:YHS domain-containing protein
MEFINLTRFGLTVCLLVLSSLVLLPPVSAQEQSAQKQGSGLVQVETKYVCMINNQRFDKEQIPVQVSGKTYYGCCEMCKTTLRNKPASRVATDPVSGKKVDKASAIIGAAPDGKVFYFENQDNLKKFRSTNPSGSSEGIEKKKGGHSTAVDAIGSHKE